MNKKNINVLKIEVVEIKDKPDGSAEIVFEISDEFKKMLKSIYGLKRFSKKAFETFVTEAINNLYKAG